MSLFNRIFNPSKNVSDGPKMDYFTKLSNKYSISDKDLELEERNKKILLEKKVNLSKVRFVHGPAFIYDFIKDEINPTIEIMVPMKEGGIFADNTKQAIQLNKNLYDSCIQISVKTYQDVRWKKLTEDIDKSERGYVFLLVNDGKDYRFETDTRRVRYVNLDDIGLPLKN